MLAHRTALALLYFALGGSDGVGVGQERVPIAPPQAPESKPADERATDEPPASAPAPAPDAPATAPPTPPLTPPATSAPTSIAPPTATSTDESAPAAGSRSLPAAKGGAAILAPPASLAPTARAAVPAYEPSYHSPEQVYALLRAWAAPREGLEIALDESWRTRTSMPLAFLAFGKSGPVPLRERPTLVLVGALDGISRAGTEAVLSIAWSLLEKPQSLPDGIALVVAPLASPDALQRAHAARLQGLGQGGNAVPIDEDGDLVADEDAPDDLDGDGQVLWMLLEEPHGPLVRAADPRFLAPARPGDGPRYRLVREGRDDDGDGSYNEDGPGGIVLDRSFPVGWRGPRVDPLGGTTPLSEPEGAALAEYLLSRKVYALLAFQGHHGGVVLPGASEPGVRGEPSLPLAADLPAFERIARTCAERLGRASREPLRAWQTRDGAGGGGSCIDWAYCTAGALALEVAPWGPEVEARLPQAGRVDGVQIAPGALLSNDAQWVRWLDDQQGGIGFCAWHPVEVGPGLRVLVGGWEPETVDNPPEDSLPAALRELDALVLDVLGAAPTLALELEAVERRGELVRIVALVRNHGLLPTGLGPQARLSLRLELPSEARLISGALQYSLDSLPGLGASPRIEWWVAAPQGAPLAIAADDRLVKRVRSEVRP
jgi:hypothetical protein